MSVHVYTAALQPATEFVVDFGFGAHTIRRKGRNVVQCWRCRKWRWASRCVVQVFYDSTRYWCRDEQCNKRKRVKR